MGNSTGNLKDLWDLFRTSPRIIGGCIWDYKDQGLLKKDSLGNEFYAYGGDYGEKYHDDNFCINGIVASDGRPKASIYECKRVFQPIECTWVDQNSRIIGIENRHSIRNASLYEAVIEFLQDGVAFRKITLPSIDLEAGEKIDLDLNPWLPIFTNRSEYHLNIRFLLKDDMFWAPKGFEIASNQLSLSDLSVKGVEVERNAELELKQDEKGYTLVGGNFTIVFDTSNGALSSYNWRGFEQIFSPLVPSFTRPITDNDDRGWKPQIKLKEWYDAVPRLRSMSLISHNKSRIVLESIYQVVENKAEAIICYTIYGDGDIHVDYKLSASTNLPNIPKVGMTCGIANDYRQITWLGRGPMENYIDKRYASDVARYSMSLDKFIEPYVMPQENGNRTDVRWMILANSHKQGLTITADSLLSMSAWPYTLANINKANHTNELIESGFITLNIDLIQMGVGGNDSWTDVAAPLEIYQIPAKDYHYSFTIHPVDYKDNGLPHSP